MREGDRIRIMTLYGPEDYTVESFRWCLGFFNSEDHRAAGNFTPLCDLYEPGPESERGYISNYGDYYTNEVQGWCDLPRQDQ